MRSSILYVGRLKVRGAGFNDEARVVLVWYGVAPLKWRALHAARQWGILYCSRSSYEIFMSYWYFLYNALRCLYRTGNSLIVLCDIYVYWHFLDSTL